MRGCQVAQPRPNHALRQSSLGLAGELRELSLGNCANDDSPTSAAVWPSPNRLRLGHSQPTCLRHCEEHPLR